MPKYGTRGRLLQAAPLNYVEFLLFFLVWHQIDICHRDYKYHNHEHQHHHRSKSADSKSHREGIIERKCMKQDESYRNRNPYP